MKEFHTSKNQKFFSNLLPDEPITISFSNIRIFILGVIFILGIAVLYIRLTNRNEIKLLESKHKEIQAMVDRYLMNMSQVNITENDQLEFDRRINEYKKQLKTIEQNMKDLKESWLP